MPTPSSGSSLMSPPPEHEDQLSFHSTCPPEEVRLYSPRSNASNESIRSQVIAEYSLASPSQQPTPPAEVDESRNATSQSESHNPQMETEEDGPARDSPTPVSATDDATEVDQRNAQPSSAFTFANSEQTTNDYGVLTSAFPKTRVSVVFTLGRH